MDERSQRVAQAIRDAKADCAILCGFDNICYATGYVADLESGPSPFSGGPALAVVCPKATPPSCVRMPRRLTRRMPPRWSPTKGFRSSGASSPRTALPGCGARRTCRTRDRRRGRGGAHHAATGGGGDGAGTIDGAGRYQAASNSSARPKPTPKFSGRVAGQRPPGRCRSQAAVRLVPCRPGRGRGVRNIRTAIDRHAGKRIQVGADLLSAR